MNPINILFSCDTNYAMPMTVCITSIFENNKENKIDVYVLYSSLFNDQKKVLIDLAQKYKQAINLIPVSEHYFSNAPTLRWTKEAYYRILINECLPKELTKIIYFDCDTVINNQIITLIDTHMDQYCVAALPEHKSSVHRKRLGLKPVGDYFQSSVLLFDLDKCRKILNYEKASKIIKELGNRLYVVDQDVINVIFDGKIKKLDKKFNNCEITNFNGNNFHRLINYCDKEEIENTIIFHYTSGKPWNNLYPGSCEDTWYKYLKLSPYKELYYNKFNTIKYKVFRFGFFKLVFYYYTKYNYLLDENLSKILPSKIFVSLKNYYRKNIK